MTHVLSTDTKDSSSKCHFYSGVLDSMYVNQLKHGRRTTKMTHLLWKISTSTTRESAHVERKKTFSLSATGKVRMFTAVFMTIVYASAGLTNSLF